MEVTIPPFLYILILTSFTVVVVETAETLQTESHFTEPILSRSTDMKPS